MALAASVRSRARSNPRAVTAVLSVIGYALVIGALSAPGTLFSLPDRTVILLGDAIAVVNTFALTFLVAGWRFIRRGDVRRHRAAMLTAFALIMVFLVLYLLKLGGGFEKSIDATGAIRIAYLLMLAIHVLLSAISVPVVLYAVTLGLTHTPAELRETAHARVGRVAVAAWSLSLFLGIVTYVLLNHVYGWTRLHG